MSNRAVQEPLGLIIPGQRAAGRAIEIVAPVGMQHVVELKYLGKTEEGTIETCSQYWMSGEAEPTAARPF